MVDYITKEGLLLIVQVKLTTLGRFHEAIKSTGERVATYLISRIDSRSIQLSETLLWKMTFFQEFMTSSLDLFLHFPCTNNLS